MVRRLVVGTLSVITLAVAACTSSPPTEPLAMTAIDMSNKVDEGNRVYSPGQIFAPTSTIYASIATQGVGKGKLAATWKDPEGKVIAEQSQEIAPTKAEGGSYWEFHITPPSEGWKIGRYSADFTLDGGGKRTRDFEVRITQ